MCVCPVDVDSTGLVDVAVLEGEADEAPSLVLRGCDLCLSVRVRRVDGVVVIFLLCVVRLCDEVAGLLSEVAVLLVSRERREVGETKDVAALDEIVAEKLLELWWREW